jgi:hypothetical protein
MPTIAFIQASRAEEEAARAQDPTALTVDLDEEEVSEYEPGSSSSDGGSESSEREVERPKSASKRRKPSAEDVQTRSLAEASVASALGAHISKVTYACHSLSIWSKKTWQGSSQHTFNLFW